MKVNSYSDRTSFSGYKYEIPVVKSWYDFYVNPMSKRNKKTIAKLIEKQKDNPHDIIMNYRGDGEIIENYMTVDGIKLVKEKFESFVSLFKRAANLADKQRNKEVIPRQSTLPLYDYNIEVNV